MGYFLYHRVVENMNGEVLYPLNRLKDIFPDSYAQHVKKYEGREHLLTTIIPTLGCLWNDVLHFTAVPPITLFANIADAGFDAKELVWKKWFKIPAVQLDPANTTVCLYRRDKSLIPEARDFSSFSLEKIPEYATVPPETLLYYREQFVQGKRPLFFHRVPHILYKGEINIKNCEIIEL